MLSVLASLPMHPLLVHIPVVMLPIAALGGIALVVRPSWVKHYGWLVVATSVVAFVGSVIAASTGEDLLEQYRNNGQTISSTLQDHADLGDTVRVMSLLLMLVIVGFVVVRRKMDGRSVPTAQDATAPSSPSWKKWLSPVLSVLVVVFAVASTIVVVEAGHNGAKSKWEQTKP